MEPIVALLLELVLNPAALESVNHSNYFVLAHVVIAHEDLLYKVELLKLVVCDSSELVLKELILVLEILD